MTVTVSEHTLVNACTYLQNSIIHLYANNYLLFTGPLSLRRIFETVRVSNHASMLQLVETLFLLEFRIRPVRHQ